VIDCRKIADKKAEAILATEERTWGLFSSFALLRRKLKWVRKVKGKSEVLKSGSER
tara:strand:+ start:194 stop:361 length:168 start_codon:yes stop_codon:yes gene_type:complete